MATKKKLLLYVFYSGNWNPTVAGEIRSANDRKKGETLDKTLSVNLSLKPQDIRDNLWLDLLPEKAPKDKYEIGRLIYAMRLYRAACTKLKIFSLEDDLLPFENSELNPADADTLDLFYKTITGTFGPSSARQQRDVINERPPEPFQEPELPKLQPIKLPAVGKTPSVKEIVGNYVMLVLTIHGLGNRRKVSSDAVNSDQEEADKEWLAVSKRLLESDELRDINYTAAKTRQFIENRSLPSLVKKGIYILNRATVEECVEHVIESNDKIDGQADSLLSAWPKLLAEAKKRLKKRFDPKDYPDPKELKDRFFIDYQLLEIKPPEPEKMSDKIFKQEKAKWEKLWETAAENADQLLTVGMIEQMNSLIAKLQSGDDGKPKQIRETALDSINEFLSTFNPRNMQNNQQLKAAADRAREIIKGISPEALRKSKNAREYVSNGFRQISKALEPMIEKKPGRAVAFDEE